MGRPVFKDGEEVISENQTKSGLIDKIVISLV
jgi:hypothetical protein